MIILDKLPNNLSTTQISIVIAVFFVTLIGAILLAFVFKYYNERRNLL